MSDGIETVCVPGLKLVRRDGKTITVREVDRIEPEYASVWIFDTDGEKYWFSYDSIRMGRVIEFNVDDFPRLSRDETRALVGAVPRATLLPALKEADEAIQQHVLGALEGAAAAEIRDALAAMRPPVYGDAEIARQTLQDAAYGLMRSGGVPWLSPVVEPEEDIDIGI
jgi:hypothetical protein